jgi:hypothetical protein
VLDEMGGMGGGVGMWRPPLGEPVTEALGDDFDLLERLRGSERSRVAWAVGCSIELGTRRVHAKLDQLLCQRTGGARVCRRKRQRGMKTVEKRTERVCSEKDTRSITKRQGICVDFV